jgi:hypothetical protein
MTMVILSYAVLGVLYGLCEVSRPSERDDDEMLVACVIRGLCWPYFACAALPHIYRFVMSGWRKYRAHE